MASIDMLFNSLNVQKSTIINLNASGFNYCAINSSSSSHVTREIKHCKAWVPFLSHAIFAN